MVVVDGGRMVPLDAVVALPDAPTLDRPPCVSGARALLAAGAAARARLAALALELAREDGDGPTLADARLAPPVPDPTQIFCLGLNYTDHVEEAAGVRAEVPEFFVKLPGGLVGHGDAIVLPRASDRIDYEGELVAVIGRKLKDASIADAERAVAGVTIMNDVSARDLQMRGSQWLPGKILDTFAPCGPVVVTDDDAGWRHGLALETRLNGDVMQEASTSMMITSIPEAAAYLSTLVTLRPGDLIATGTPSGVGFVREPPVYLRAGDVVEITVEGVGTLRNTVAA